MKRLLHRPSIDLPSLTTLGAAIAAISEVGDVILLEGDLGSGKTTLARAFLGAMGVAEDIPSPTFTLVQIYEGIQIYEGAQPYEGRRGGAPLMLYHFDLYRLQEREEVYELGLEDAFESGVSLIEWPQIAAGLMPAERLEIRLSTGPDPATRDIAITGSPAWARRLDWKTL